MAKAKPEAPSAAKAVVKPLDELHLDWKNPRFAGQDASRNEVALLDHIVDNYGIEDVLASIATNGYFFSEPLVGRLEPGEKGVRIVEGNRRLAALLVIAGDERARNQKLRTQAARKILGDRDAPTEVPVVLIEAGNEKRWLAYLGVRHIVGAQPWDSYAKARWIADVLKGKPHERLTIDEIVTMLGDSQRIVVRILEGYYVSQQLEQEERFRPKESYHRGRGSNVSFPFSWIYTALGYTGVRKFLNLGEKGTAPRENPLVGEKGLDAGEELLLLLFGDKSQKRQPAVDESRDIKDLAGVIGETKFRKLLIDGKRLKDVVEMKRPPVEQAVNALIDAGQSLSSAWNLLGTNISKRSASEGEWRDLKNAAREADDRAGQIVKKLSELE